MSDKPVIAGRAPIKVELEAGKKYAFCTCGLAESQPFCDGKHKGTSFVPNVFTAEQSGVVSLCACKHTAATPKCDGAHKNLG